MKSLKENIDILLELGKVRITFFVAVSTSAGFLQHAGKFTWDILLPSLGVFILACGSSAFNHYQERKTDALMDRTKGRPLPSGRISETNALIYASSLVLIGLALIYFSSNITAMLLGVTALIWYNIIYTPLKKKYALAVVPGALIGAIPPVIGWAASGGFPFDYKILAIALFFFIWQIPHFWLLLLIYYKDYQKAGFPTLNKTFSESQLSRITYIWIAALAVSSLMIPLLDISYHVYSFAALVALGIWLVLDTKKILSGYLEKVIFRKAFLAVNIYVLAVIIIISIDKLLLNEI